MRIHRHQLLIMNKMKMSKCLCRLFIKNECELNLLLNK